MAIRQAKYIDITSGVGGKSAVKNREFIARVFTTNELCGFGHVYEFDSLDEVGKYFGTESEEYNWASRYFGFVSKTITKAKKISFMKWADDTNDGSGSGASTYSPNAYVLGLSAPSTTMTNYPASNGKLVLVLDGVRYEYIASITEPPATINDVALAVQAAITSDATYPLTGTTVTVTSDSKIKVDFGSSTANVHIGGFEAQAVTAGAYDLATLLGINKGNSVCSDYAPAETPVNAAIRSDSISDNYGSFIFLGGIIDDSTYEKTKAVIEWNKSKNYKYLFLFSGMGYTSASGGLTENGLVSMATAVKGMAPDSVLSAYRFENDAIDSLISALFATTDYQRTNSTKCFMYQQNSAIEPSITSDASANALDTLNVNYMGETQSAGGKIAFLQDGVAIDGTDIGVVCNEIWMKSSFWTAIMNLLLTVEKVPANEDGVGLLKTVMMGTITTAIRNGTIQPRKTLTTNQKVYIGQVTGNSEAWKDVYNDGYVLDLKIEADDNNRYVAKYVLVYSKGDAVRKIEGADILV